MENSPILIISKNCKTGRWVNKRLQTLLYPTRAGSRSTSPSFGWEQPETWQPAMEGAVSANVTYQPDLAIPAAILGRPATDFRTYAQQTVTSGVWDTPQHKEST